MKNFSFNAASFLFVKHGTGRTALNRDTGDDDDWNGDRQSDERSGDVFAAFEESVPKIIERPFARAEQWDLVNVLHIYFCCEQAEEIGHHQEVGEVAFALQHNVQKDVLGQHG
ncbi:MAG: hypothetical protein M5U15_13305 [Kiritimatiellae bacterium]|nr:hypothetical protein [Kiritimatiellia bacterium]